MKKNTVKVNGAYTTSSKMMHIAFTIVEKEVDFVLKRFEVISISDRFGNMANF